MARKSTGGKAPRKHLSTVAARKSRPARGGTLAGRTGGWARFWQPEKFQPTGKEDDENPLEAFEHTAIADRLGGAEGYRVSARLALPKVLIQTHRDPSLTAYDDFLLEHMKRSYFDFTLISHHKYTNMVYINESDRDNTEHCTKQPCHQVCRLLIADFAKLCHEIV